MGLKVSTTCELTFGGDPDRPAVGTLVGGVHDGIRQMFMIIENARMLVGTKAIETLSTGYLNALDYAKNRVQGPDLTEQADKGSPRVTIIHHPDVRRHAHAAEGVRGGHAGAGALHGHAAGRRADRRATTAEQDPAAAARNDLLLPVVKGLGAERAYEMLALSLQTLGGSGFLQDYPMEQYIRDSKIDSLYEGTTAIQSLDFFFRKMVRDQGAAVKALLAEMASFATDSRDDGNDNDGRLKTERLAIAEGVTHFEAMVNAMTGFLIGSLEQPEEIYKVGQQSVRLLLAFGDLIVAWLLARQAEVAGRALEGAAPGGTGALTESERDFYTGKIASARFFATTVLPRLASDRRIIEETTNDLMEVPEGAF